jgi:(p)ppGpp synthase/HD superfamily hydrolase
MNLSKAIATASNCFINVNDRGGKPYILHCLHVMHNVSHLGDTAMICAVHVIRNNLKAKENANSNF